MHRIVFVLIALAPFVPACANARSTIEEQAQSIEAQVWSPYCPGRLLIDCTTSQARQLRTQITRRLEDGESAAHVLDWIERNHGREALARPDGGGAGLVVWLVPIALFALGAVVVVMLIRRWSRLPARSAKTTA
jgi:cytochrome c-type biogenesis protein CcmH/NrfF